MAATNCAGRVPCMSEYVVGRDADLLGQGGQDVVRVGLGAVQLVDVRVIVDADDQRPHVAVEAERSTGAAIA